MAVSVRFRRRGRTCRGARAPVGRSRRWGRRRRGGCSRSAWSRCSRGVRRGSEPLRETEGVVGVSGQLALAISEERLVAAAVWETLPVEAQGEVTVRLARLLARLVEVERDE